MAKAKHCHCMGYQLLGKAFDRYPQSWYGRYWGQVLIGGIIAWAFAQVQIEMHLFPNLQLSILGAIFYITGFVADIYSTDFVVRMKVDFDHRGLDFPVEERNPFLPAHPNLKNMLMNKGIVLEGIGVVSSFFIPSVGMGVLCARLLTAKANLEYKKRLEWILKMVDRLANHAMKANCEATTLKEH